RRRLRVPAVFPPAVFLAKAFVFTAAFFNAGVLVKLFFGAAFFLASFFLTIFLTGFPFFAADLFSFVCFFLVFLLGIRAVYHRHIPALKAAAICICLVAHK